MVKRKTMLETEPTDRQHQDERREREIWLRDRKHGPGSMRLRTA